jgi:hypothetical protein
MAIPERQRLAEEYSESLHAVGLVYNVVSVYMCMLVCMRVCMSVCAYVFMHVCMYACTYLLQWNTQKHAMICLYEYACMHSDMYGRTCIFTHVYFTMKYSKSRQAAGLICMTVYVYVLVRMRAWMC